VQVEDEAGMFRSGAGLAFTRYSPVDIVVLLIIRFRYDVSAWTWQTSDEIGSDAGSVSGG